VAYIQNLSVHLFLGSCSLQVGMGIIHFFTSNNQHALSTSLPGTNPMRAVEEGYEYVEEHYTRLKGATACPRTRWLAKLLSCPQPDSSVLDIGCGSDESPDAEIAKTHQVTGVDLARIQIQLARINVPNAQFLHENSASVNFSDGEFNAVVPFYALEHILREEHAGILERIHRWLRVSGYLLLSTEAGEYEGLCSWLGVLM